MKLGLKVTMMGLAATSMLLQACGGDSASEKKAKSVQQILESDGSGSWTEIKTDSSRINNYAVFLGPDGKYYAFNTKVATGDMTKAQYLAAATYYTDLKKNTVYSTVWGQPDQAGANDCIASTSTTPSDYSCESWDRDQRGVPAISYSYNATFDETDVTEITYKDSSGLIFQVGDGSSKDLESVSATIEASSNEALREQLVSGYGLSENRATEIASLAKSWQNISKSRSMTSKDLVQFQSKVFGTDMNTLKKAAMKSANGDAKDFNSLIQKAAALNDISPEQAKAIFKDFAN